MVAGGEAVFLDLLDQLPTSRCRLLFCETVGQVLDRASSAQLVVVDADLPGGGEELCRRLRAQAQTQALPLVLRGGKRPTPQGLVDAVVPAEGLTELMSAIERLCPGLGATGARASSPAAVAELAKPAAALPAPATATRGGAAAVGSPRGPSAASASGWPPTPPTQASGEPFLAFSVRLAEYLQSVMDRLRSPDPLSEADRQGFLSVVGDFLTTTDALLQAGQRAINEALSAGDLQQMRLLTTERNGLVERFQALRSAQQQVSQPVEALEAGAVTLPSLQKSALTRAYEAKQAQGPKAAPRPRRPTSTAGSAGSAARQRAGQATRSVSGWLVVGALGGLALLGGGGYWLWQRSQAPGSSPATRGSNAAPLMRWVTVTEGPTGFVVQPKAEDPEGDRVTFAIRWLVDGKLVVGAHTARLGPENYRGARSVQAEVTPLDPLGPGKAMVSQPRVPAAPKTDSPPPPPSPRRK